VGWQRVQHACGPRKVAAEAGKMQAARHLLLLLLLWLYLQPLRASC
jgi:hypothetical protein